MSSQSLSTKHKRRIVLLGTGTPNPSLSRMSSGYLIEIDEDRILFDHGTGSHHRLMELGIRSTEISHLFFSHLHYDHCLDYARLVLTRWDQGHGEIPELLVYGPAGTLKMTEALFGKEGAFSQDIQARTHHPGSIQTFELRGGIPPRRPPFPKVTELENSQIVEGKGWRVTCAEVIHVQPYLACYGYRIDWDGGSLTYSGDTGKSEDLIRLARGSDVLIHMCHQISGTEPGQEWTRAAAGHLEAAETADKAGVRNLVLTHIPSQMDVPGVRERIIKEVAGLFDGNIFWGEDLMTIPPDDPTPRRHTG
jgi:ribonuclease BN (tRNA processing enzyme)